MALAFVRWLSHQPECRVCVSGVLSIAPNVDVLGLGDDVLLRPNSIRELLDVETAAECRFLAIAYLGDVSSLD